MVALGAIVSIVLAVAVSLRPNRAVIAIFEINHQMGADRIGLAALAGVIAALRVATIIGSAYLFRFHRPAAT